MAGGGGTPGDEWLMRLMVVGCGSLESSNTARLIELSGRCLVLPELPRAYNPLAASRKRITHDCDIFSHITGDWLEIGSSQNSETANNDGLTSV